MGITKLGNIILIVIYLMKGTSMVVITMVIVVIVMVITLKVRLLFLSLILKKNCIKGTNIPPAAECLD